ncbi:uncharacterized protein BP01DRAFT_388716 [Aspergillus saccharolyticus JOP 1030-1]|uniref:P-loop containing nucleoside triphosphate hydrolase protein n=1 Tax=Aspergillus saccharolyticus JOP 1030-1 TaxID=1450539 RepID=A0A318ZMQ5_9EURO|nr:P-loop containing nucleoside triphosphate hydrolase protein [Aspergillus saccharolyticus JOP 1030-1]PYH48879.1 P-loop containing nucleoside triphosphate hydrolase protein [Aspergillus saccharolyticus JOP 1030-1]
MNRLDNLGLTSQDPHRVISFPASQSLHASTESAALGNKTVSTGLPRLDEAVTSPLEDDLQGLEDFQTKGLPCGHVTEIFGPPSAGKTAIALNAAAAALAKGEKVVWIDTGPPLPRRRLNRLLAAHQQQQQQQPTTNPTQNLTHIHTPTLPHLLSLLHHPPPTFPPPTTTLLIIDSISAPFPPYFPNPSDQRAALAAQQQQQQQPDKAHIQWLLNRKWNVLGDVATQLAKLAASQAGAMAVLVTNQMHTRIRGQVRATLCPVVAGSAAWESCVFTRMVVYQDFVLSAAADGSMGEKGRVVEVMKRGGRVVRGRVVGDNVLGVGVREDGLYVLDSPPPAIEGEVEEKVEEQQAELLVEGDSTAENSASQRKRKAEEIADSQDEDDSEGDFGWMEEAGAEMDAVSSDEN